MTQPQKAQHTPGPWKVYMDLNVESEKRSICSCAVQINNNPNNHEVNKANATLIAAAPKLKAFADWYVENREERAGLLLQNMGWDYRGKESAQEFVRRFVRETIAKVEGRQP